MFRSTLDDRTQGRGTPQDATETSRERELELRILQLEEEQARLRRERLEYELLGEDLVGQLDESKVSELHRYLHERQQHPEMLRNGRIVSVSDVPPEAILNLADLIYWRHALAESTGLLTFLYVNDEGQARPVGNSPSQLPALASVRPECRRGVDRAVAAITASETCPAGNIGARCDGCGRPLWIVPIRLRYEHDVETVGCLVGHDLPTPSQPHRRMVELVADMTGRRASEEYAGQVNTILQMQVTAMVAKYTLQKSDAAREAGEALDRQSRIAEDLARAKSELETVLAEAREARRAAERANDSKGLIMAAMSHEIRTPLTCVIGFADLLARPSLTIEDAHKFAESIKESGQVLLSLINNILDLSKLEAGHLELERVDYSVRQLLDEVVGIFTPSCREKDIDIRVAIDDAVAQEQVGDPMRLRQVLMNLVSNAIKFTREGGVDLACGPDPDDPDLLRIEVRDTGAGIPSDRLDTIFEAYRQGDPEVSRKHGGTGLGLAISKHISEVMGGELSVTSREGEGSCFVFTFADRLPEGIPTPSGAA